MSLETLVRSFHAARICWIISSVAVLAACTEEELPTSKTEHTGSIRPVGTALGPIETYDIGPRGGSIASADGKIDIMIPEGALTSSAAFGIQMIASTVPNGVGGAYRFTPHAVEFNKPVTITFTYNEDSVSFEEGMGVAFQGEDGVWYWPGTLKHDRDANKLTVETMHFSDWSLFESIKILPAYVSLAPNGEVVLQAYGTFPEEVEDDLLTPLVPPDPVPLAEPAPLDTKYIDEWSVQGEGTLVSTGNSATYKAPSTVPDINPVRVHLKLKLKTGQAFLLTSTISIGASSVILTGGPYSNETFYGSKPGAAAYDPAKNLTSIYVLLYRSDGASVGISISFHGKTVGQETWNQPDCFVSTSHTTTASDRLITGTYFTYDNNSNQDIHPGYIKVTKYSNAVGGTIAGTFQGNFTFMDSNCDYCKFYGTVTGNFTAIRIQ
jgi:hypothetical protein